MNNIPFQPKGLVSQANACLTVFRTLEPGGWASQEDLHARVEELTGTEVAPGSLKGAVWQAGEQLVRDGELGIDWYQYGYRRHTAESLADSVEVRLDRAARHLGRMDVRVKAALNQAELPPWRTHRLQQLASNTLRQAALAARRGNRHRPLPPGEPPA